MTIPYESIYGNLGRNTFRGPFQFRFDTSLAKEFAINERFRLRFNFDAFNIFNHPDFDTPNNDVVFFAGYSRAACFPTARKLGHDSTHDWQFALLATGFAPHFLVRR